MPPPLSRRALALAGLLAVSLLLLLCSTDPAQARPQPRHGRRYEEQQQQQQQQLQEEEGRSLAASDASASAAPSPPTPTLALLVAPAPTPSSAAAAAAGAPLVKPGQLQEAKKGAAAAPSPSPSAISAGDDEEEEEEDEEASSDDGDGDVELPEESSEDQNEDPDTQAGVAEDVASAYRAPSAATEPPAVAGKPKRVKFLARGANKAINQSEVDASSLSGEKGSFVFYGRYCGPGWTDKQNRPGIDPVDEACRAHDACYGQAHEDQPPEHKIRRAAAECGCDKKLVSALKDFKKNKQQQAEATKAAKRAANDMIDLFDLKCPISVAGAVLRPPSPATAPGGGGQGKC